VVKRHVGACHGRAGTTALLELLGSEFRQATLHTRERDAGGGDANLLLEALRCFARARRAVCGGVGETTADVP